MIQTNYSLKEYSTLKVGGPAEFYTEVSSVEELTEAVNFAKQNNLKITTLGSISNVIIADEGIKGLVIRFKNKNIEVLDENTIKADTGVLWDDFVSFCVEKDLFGVENLSLIPGTVGSSAIQNIGAYGQEAAETIDTIHAYDIKNECYTTLKKEDCNFSYRRSIFNTEEKGRYIIHAVTFKLNQNKDFCLGYKDLAYFRKDNHLSLDKIRQEIIKIRQEKLPDYNILPNVGSFFKNVVVERSQLMEVYHKALELNPEKAEILRAFKIDNEKVKIPTALLIEICGLKGYKAENMCIYDKHALILVHHSKQGSTKELLEFADFIKNTVLEKLGVTIEREPVIIN